MLDHRLDERLAHPRLDGGLVGGREFVGIPRERAETVGERARGAERGRLRGRRRRLRARGPAEHRDHVRHRRADEGASSRTYRGGFPRADGEMSKPTGRSRPARTTDERAERRRGRTRDAGGREPSRERDEATVPSLDAEDERRRRDACGGV